MAELATIARPYADALFKASRGNLPQTQAWLDQLAAAASSQELLDFAANPRVNATQVFHVLTSAIKDSLPEHGVNFLRMVIDNDRLAAVPEVARQFRVLANEVSGSSDAVIVSAFPIDQAELQQLIATLEKRFGRKLEASVKIDPEFRFKICGVREETPYDTSKYQMQPNPELPEAGGVKLAADEKEVLLLELFPLVAKTFLTNMKVKAYEASKPAEPAAKAGETPAGETQAVITGNVVTAPLPGRIIELKVKVGDAVKAGQEVAVLEAMKMENAITSDFAGTVKQILVRQGQTVATDAVLMEIE